MAQKRASFEIAKALKEVGYPQGNTDNKVIPTYYSSNGRIAKLPLSGVSIVYYAPFLFDVMCWLMETHNIYISVQKTSKDSNSCCYIYQNSNCEYEYFDEWDEAFEWGIKQAIKKL